MGSTNKTIQMQRLVSLSMVGSLDETVRDLAVCNDGAHDLLFQQRLYAIPRLLERLN